MIIAHLTGEDLDKAIMKLYNLTDETEVKKMKSMAPKQCPACATYNIHTNEFCAACLTPLSEDAVRSTDLLKDDVIGNPKASSSLISRLSPSSTASISSFSRINARRSRSEWISYPSLHIAILPTFSNDLARTDLVFPLGSARSLDTIGYFTRRTS
ncbi:MAG: hypothetical protein WCK53_10975 [Methanomicrobiales archaeon]